MGYLFTGKCRHGIFSIPHALIDSGALSELSPAACKMLVFLYAAMNSRSAPCIRISGKQLSGGLEMDSKTIRAARRELESKNAIRCERAAKAGAPYELHLVNLETGEPFPPENERPKIADYKPRKSKSSLTVPENADSPVRVRTPTLAKVGLLPAQEESPLRGATPEDAVSHAVERVCHIHGNRNVWHRVDGSPVCGICHPESSEDAALHHGPCASASQFAASPGVDSVMTEHGLPIKF
jgi:hypothetical protein